jgi:hypothetical protein
MSRSVNPIPILKARAHKDEAEGTSRWIFAWMPVSVSHCFFERILPV